MWIILRELFRIFIGIVSFFVRSWNPRLQACRSQKWRSDILKPFTRTQHHSGCSAILGIQMSSSKWSTLVMSLLEDYFNSHLKAFLFFMFFFLRSIPVAWRSDFVAESKEAESKMASLKERLLLSHVKVTEKWVMIVFSLPLFTLFACTSDHSTHIYCIHKYILYIKEMFQVHFLVLVFATVTHVSGEVLWMGTHIWKTWMNLAKPCLKTCGGL